MRHVERSCQAILVATLGLCLFGLSACGGGAKQPSTDGAAGGSGDGGVMSGPATTCLGIRKCLFACGQDQSCAGRCVSAASAGARTPYDKLQMCTRKECPTGDEGCRCDTECFSDGMCFETAVECANAESDPMCEELCH